MEENKRIYEEEYRKAVKTVEDIFRRHGLEDMVSFEKAYNFFDLPTEINFEIKNTSSSDLFSPAILGHFTGTECTAVVIFIGKSISTINLTDIDEEYEDYVKRVAEFSLKVINDSVFRKELEENMKPAFTRLKELYVPDSDD